MRAAGWRRVVVMVLASVGMAGGQEPAVPSASQPVPQGTVLFERKAEQENPARAVKKAGAPEPVAAATDAEREAVTFTAYDLDVHLVPAESRIAVHAVMKVRNDGAVPLDRLALQISSSLRWESLTVVGSGQVVRPALTQHAIDTDADHTGRAQEAVVALPQALARGASLEVTAIYSGTIAASAERLERIGAGSAQAEFADWDVVSSQGTYLRGYGQVLWYPTAGAPVLLGDGAKFFQAVGRSRLRQAGATVRLRLALEFLGEAPDAAYFCGRREQMTALSENANVPVAEAPGVAVAEFASEQLGFRSPSLFVTDRRLSMAEGQVIGAVTDNPDALPAYAAAAGRVQPLLVEWLGSSPLTPLNVLDHKGQPFEDDALLVTPMAVGTGTGLTTPAELDVRLVHSLTHAWFHSAYPWMDEGLAQFMMILWTERTEGREAALAQLQSSQGALALTEPDLSVAGAASAKPAGQSLVEASSEVYYRTKAAAVWWMLRSIVGEEALKRALQEYRRDGQMRRDGRADGSAGGFEKMLEKTSQKDLRWFFDDWVDHDRGLPDLAIVSVTPREMPSQNGKAASWLVAVEVRNEGAAVADVPVTVRSGLGAGSLTKTERLRIRGHSSASTRILFESTPEEVVVNDGEVPEMGVTTHRKQLTLTAR